MDVQSMPKTSKHVKRRQQHVQTCQTTSKYVTKWITHRVPICIPIKPPPRGDLQAGWRRGKQMDNFNKRVGVVSEAVFLDDPGLWTLSIDNLKSFLDVAEDSTSNARYVPAKFVKNGVRGIADNEFDEADEPAADNRTEITAAESERLFQKPFSGWKKSHVLAVLKRSIVVIAGSRAMYVRLPSKDANAIVHRIAVAGIEQDWLRDKKRWGDDNKEFYGHYKRGAELYYDGFAEQVAEEQKLVDAAVAARGGQRPEDFITECNQKLQELLRAAPTITVRVVADTPSPPTGAEPMRIAPDDDGSYRIPRAAGLNERTSSKRNAFAPDFAVRRRIRMKQSASPDEAEALVDVGMEDAALGRGQASSSRDMPPEENTQCEG